MNIQRQFKSNCGLAVSVAAFALISVAAQAQQTTVEGLIVGRSGPTMAVKTADSPRVMVLLSDSTKATEKGGGFLGMGHKDLGITELVPGLAVKVEGSYDPDHRLVARKVTFSRASLKTARQIDAGLNPVNAEVAAAQDDIRTTRRGLESTQQDVDAARQDIASGNQTLSAHGEAIEGNKQAIGQANQRFGKLDEYETKGTYTVNFANGKTAVGRRYKDELAEFVKTAADQPGYMIQVQGYASTKGSPAINQRLSAERAEAVVSLIQQTGAVPLTKILAPAAMGTSHPAETGRGKGAQAQNRRVVVTILVNKGING